MKSEQVAGFVSESMAGFIGIRNKQMHSDNLGFFRIFGAGGFTYGTNTVIDSES